MKPLHPLGILAGILFLVSFALPAYAQANGLECLKFCWGEIFDFKATSFGGGVYYPAFVLTNALFVLLSFGALRPQRPSAIAVVLSLAASGHVLSWLVMNLSHHDEKFEIKVGYFVWLAAYLLLSYLVIKRRKVASA